MKIQLDNNLNENVIDVVKNGDKTKILILKPDSMKMEKWEEHVVNFQKFMSDLNIKARRIDDERMD